MLSAEVYAVAEVLQEQNLEHPFMWQRLKTKHVTAQAAAAIDDWCFEYLVQVLDSLEIEQKTVLLEKLKKIDATFINLPLEAVARLKSTSIARLLDKRSNSSFLQESLMEPALFYGLKISLPIHDFMIVLAKSWGRFVHLLDPTSLHRIKTEIATLKPLTPLKPSKPSKPIALTSIKPNVYAAVDPASSSPLLSPPPPPLFTLSSTLPTAQQTPPCFEDRLRKPSALECVRLLFDDNDRKKTPPRKKQQQKQPEIPPPANSKQQPEEEKENKNPVALSLSELLSRAKLK